MSCTELPVSDTTDCCVNEFGPQFERVSITGFDASGVPPEELQNAACRIIEALELRRHYMELGMQEFPSLTTRFLQVFKEPQRYPCAKETSKKILQMSMSKRDLKQSAKGG